MFYSEIDPMQAYAIGQSSGTVAVSQFRLGEEDTLIAIENVVMIGGDVFLRAVPSRTRSQETVQAQPAVVASLERSLKENADVWAELSKY